MDHPGLMDRGECRGDTDAEPVQLVGSERATRRDRPLKVGTRNVLTDDVGPGVLEVHGDDPGGAERRHPPGRLDLLGEPVE
ncbi:hypothetical protein GCM10009780_66990 [Actinomadura alba]